MRIRSFISSALRIAVATVLAFSLGVTIIGLFLRQPSFRSTTVDGAERADPNQLRNHVEYLARSCFPRNLHSQETLDKAADYLHTALATAGAHVDEMTYRVSNTHCRNIRARFGPEGGTPLIVGAHYDVFGAMPGADDNASGTAGLLELGRLLGTIELLDPVELLAYSTEEPPSFGSSDMGSAVHAASIRELGTTIRGMICLEMIGFFTERQPSVHPLVDLIYPRSGDFIVVVGRWDDRWLARHVKAGLKGAGGFRACSYSGPPILGADLSDHRNYWAAGFSAVMVTDTVMLRNPNYHTEGDTPETLDYERMAAVVDGVFNAVVTLDSRSPLD